MNWIEKRVPPAKTLGWVGIFYTIIVIIALATGVGLDFGRGAKEPVYRDEDPEGFQRYVTFFSTAGIFLVIVSRFKLTKIEKGISQMWMKITESKTINTELGWFGYAALGLALLACVGIGIKVWN